MMGIFPANGKTPKQLENNNSYQQKYDNNYQILKNEKFRFIEERKKIM